MSRLLSMKSNIRRKSPTRTVKVSDVLHHRIRVLSVQKRIPLQDFVESMLTVGLREKIYDKFVEDESAKPVTTAATPAVAQ
jgi:hypothetical protein